MGDIQYAPLPVPPKEDPPEWLVELLKFFARLFEPLGRLMGGNWSWIEGLLAVLGVAGAMWILWTLFQRWQLARALTRPAEEHLVIDHAAALALLADADALAAAGRFDEAVHLLLQRSVHHIAAARPDWLSPSSTAREIGLIPGLPAAARQAFTLIAREVERSLYALRALAADDWQRARAAYAAFALEQVEGRKLGGAS
ncbi:hypothetical protein AQZ52_03885 [Novosphingobium fuchskuhlense]|uniref:DUF4129 domain-containing protein n=2 Tax=Novosphingobium fuchskuhlense TaxID=1117702 RepID=A0A124JVL5_9SPHN|nr:hypothetical protein AQZ52_03885 [Novosphingobium fuchskuhlense]